MDTTWGPQPTPTSGLSPARGRVAAALGRLGPEAALADLADELGGHPNATRQHLDGLVADGFADVAERHGAGRGRPARVYTLTAAGRRALAGPVAPVAEVLGALASHLAAAPDAGAQALAIGRAWGSSRRGGRDDLLATLDELGFSPVEAAPSGAPESGGPASGAQASGSRADVIRLLTCPMLESARAHPEVVCAIHEGLIQAALAEGTPGARIIPFAEPDCCVVEFPISPPDPSPRRPDPSPRRHSTS